MANAARGEAIIELGGVSYMLTLNMRTAGELKTAFGRWEDGLNFEEFDADRYEKFMTCLLRGNKVEITDEVKDAIMDLPVHKFMPFMMEICGALTPEEKSGDGPLDRAAATEPTPSASG